LGDGWELPLSVRVPPGDGVLAREGRRGRLLGA